MTRGTPLRAKMIRELELQQKSPRTIDAYVGAVAQLAKHFHRSPDRISREEIRSFLHLLLTKRKLSSSSVNQKLMAFKCSRFEAAKYASDTEIVAAATWRKWRSFPPSSSSPGSYSTCCRRA